MKTIREMAKNKYKDAIYQTIFSSGARAVIKALKADIEKINLNWASGDYFHGQADAYKAILKTLEEMND